MPQYNDKNMAPEINVDFETITSLFDSADKQGRKFLFEHETYELLGRSGAETPPRTKLLARGTKPSGLASVATTRNSRSA